MAIVKCANGHFYNNSEYGSCPACSGQSPIGRTIPLDGSVNIGATEYINSNAPAAQAAGFDPTIGPEDAGSFGHTQMIDSNKNSEILPVRGWLVVIDGEKIGLEKRIHTGKNSIGRGKDNDICIEFDNTISKEKACFVVYDDKNKAFHLIAGESSNNIYVNNELLIMSAKLNDFDIIEIGQTKLVFRSLCNETFSY
ncbi:MAG: FHA domain-containing protein [Clostridia bacterium]|nr:FHA domain-containing protein [Clostridia bacterium]